MGWLRCPHCAVVFQAPDGMPGAVLACPHCKGLCRSPVVAPATVPLPAPPPPPAPALQTVLEVEEVLELSADTIEKEPAATSPETSADIGDAYADAGTVRRRAPRRGRRAGPPRSGAGSLDKVGLALGLHYAGTAVMLGSVGLMAIVVMIGGITTSLGIGSAIPGDIGLSATRARVFGQSAVADALSFGYLLISFVPPVTGAIGAGLCLGAPARSGLRGLAIASLAVNAVAFLVSLIVFAAASPKTPGGAALRALPVFFLVLAGWVLFVILLRQLSEYVSEPSMADESMYVLVRGCLILVLTPLALVALVGMAGRWFGIVLALGVVAQGLFASFRLLRRQLDLIGSLRQVIASRF